MTKICLRVIVPEHNEHNRSPLTQNFRFWGVGNTSYVAPIKNLILLSSILHSSFQLSFFFFASSQFNHRPCLASVFSFAVVFFFPAVFFDLPLCFLFCCCVLICRCRFSFTIVFSLLPLFFIFCYCDLNFRVTIVLYIKLN